MLCAAALTLALAPSGCAGVDPLFADSSIIATDGGGASKPDAPRCLPNNDGEISLDELIFAPGVRARYRVNPANTAARVDVVGQSVSGQRIWDFSDRSGDVIDIALERVSGTWFAKYFPTAEYAAPQDRAGKTLQVLQRDGQRLLLLGIVSREPERTRLVYDQPVALLRFPLRVGDAFVSNGTITDGRLDGASIATQDRYEVRVDAAGTVRLPLLNLHRTLRVRVDVTSRAIGVAQPLLTRQVQWFHECYGEVARAVSKRDEPSANFSTAVEFRRLSF